MQRCRENMPIEPAQHIGESRTTQTLREQKITNLAEKRNHYY